MSPVALADAERPAVAADRHILNSGGAYGGEMVLGLSGSLRLSARGELPMLAEHNRDHIVGAWRDLRVDDDNGRPVITAGDNRFADGDAVPMARKYEALWLDDLVWAMSIGFSAEWYDRSQLEEDHAAYSEGGGWYLDNWEVFEASLVAVGADAGSRRGDLCLADGSAPVAAPVAAPALADEPDDMEQDDDRERMHADAQETAAQWMLEHLVRHHGYTVADAEAEIRAISDGAPYVPADDHDDEPAEEVEDEPAEAEPEEVEEEDQIEEEVEEVEGPDELAEIGAFFDVPADVREAAQRGLDDAERYGRATDGKGVETARALASGRVAPEVVVDMDVWWSRWFDADPVSQDTPEGEPHTTEIRWDQWGGKPQGREFARANRADADAEIRGEEAADSAPEEAPGAMAAPPSLAELFPGRAAPVTLSSMFPGGAT